MSALAIDPQPVVRASRCSITLVDTDGALFGRLRAGVCADLGASVALVSARRALDWAADLRIIVLAPLRDWTAVAQLCADGPTLVIGAAVTAADAFAAIRAGARGCLDLSLSDRALSGAIRGILAGEVAFSRVALGAWFRQQSPLSAGGPDTRLTPRQQEIVSHIARGASDKEIAAALGIATATAQKHVSNLLTRLGAPNRAAAVAISAGLFERSERPSG